MTIGVHFMAYPRGEVVLVPFPFADLKSTKARPALVVSDPSYETSTGNLILVMITSQPRKIATDYALADWTSAGLKKPSVVRIKIATISTTLVLLKLGRITQNDLYHVEARMRQVLKL